DIEARRLQADIHIAFGADEPEPALMSGGVDELDLDNRPAARHDGGVQTAVHGPYQPPRIQILVADVSGPTLAPSADRGEHGSQLIARFREDVGGLLAGALLWARHDAGGLQCIETLFEQAWPDSRHAAVDVAESRGACAQLAEDQQHPALRQGLGSQGQGTELSVPFAHGWMVHPGG